MSTDTAGAPALFTVTARLNARLQPEHCQELFADPLAAWLMEAGQGAVGIGQSGVDAQGEVQHIDLRIALLDAKETDAVVEALEELGAPLGSRLLLADGQERGFGRLEGLALYLDGQNLADGVYEQCDPHEVFEQVGRAINGIGDVCSFWQGEAETALYLYGQSFQAMHQAIAGFLASYPLCAGCRVVRVA